MRQHSQRLPSGDTALTPSHNLTRLQQADNWQTSGEVGNQFSFHTPLFAYIFALPAYIYSLKCKNLVLK